MDDFFSRIRARSEGTERKPLASGALRMLSTLLLLIFVCWRNLTRWCARRSRVRRRTDSAPDRSWSTRATRRRWPRSDTRSGSAVPFRTGRRTDLCSDRWRRRRTSAARSAVCAPRLGRLCPCLCVCLWVCRRWKKNDPQSDPVSKSINGYTRPPRAFYVDVRARTKKYTNNTIGSSSTNQQWLLYTVLKMATTSYCCKPDLGMSTPFLSVYDFWVLRISVFHFHGTCLDLNFNQFRISSPETLQGLSVF